MAKVKVDITADGSGFHRVLGGIGSAVTGLKAKLAAAFSIGTIGYLSKQVLDFGDSIQAMADNFDISTDSAQRFAWAARNAGIEIGVIEKAMLGLDDAMRKALSPGGEKEKGILAKLGLTEKDLNNLKKDEALFKILKSTEGMEGPKVEGMLKDLGISSKVAGRIVGARKNILDKSIPIVSENTIKKLDAVGDAMSNIKNIILQALIPALLSFTKVLLSFVGGFIQKIGAIETFKNAGYLQAESEGTDTKSILGPAGVNKERQLAFTKKYGKGFWSAGVVPGPTVGTSMNVNSNLTESQKEQMQKDLDEYWLFIFGGSKKALENAKAALGDLTKQGTIAQISKVLEDLRAALAPQPGDPDFIGPVQPKPQVGVAREPITQELKKPEKFDTNEFVKIGGVLGINLQYRMEKIAEETRNFTERTAIATEAWLTYLRTVPGQQYSPFP